MSAPRVSIGLPVFNGEKYLELAIRSVLGQTYTDFELILSDNASTDRTEEICRKYAAIDSRVRYHRNSTNIGANNNFNHALSMATGEFFKWAAYDDLCRPKYLERCVAALDADPRILLCHTRTAIIDESGCFIDNRPEVLREHGLSADELADPPRGLDKDCPACRFREIILHSKWCFEIFGLMRTSALPTRSPLDDYYGTDKVFIAMLALKGRFWEVDEELFLRRYHAAQSSEIPTRAGRAAWSGVTTPGRHDIMQWKCLSGYHHAMRHAQLRPTQRLMCYGALAQYILQFHKWPRVIGLSKRRHFRFPRRPMARTVDEHETVVLK